MHSGLMLYVFGAHQIHITPGHYAIEAIDKLVLDTV
jgi:hypothetical protein